MTEFVIQQRSELMFKELGKACCKYADFLKQPLKLEMFVPCNDEGNVLEEPEIYSQWVREKFNDGLENEQQINECKKYHQAKERVLFKGFEWDFSEEMIVYELPNNGQWQFAIDDLETETIESFGGIEYQIELTPTALKQIYG